MTNEHFSQLIMKLSVERVNYNSGRLCKKFLTGLEQHKTYVICSYHPHWNLPVIRKQYDK